MNDKINTTTKERSMNDKTMLCSACRTSLVPGEDQCYETLDEHICDPNAEERPVRGTLVCPNQECAAHQKKLFWAFDGEGPYGRCSGIQWIDGNPNPFGSYHRAIHFRCGYHEEDRSFKLGRLTVRREVTYASDDYGNKTGKHVHYTVWRNDILWQPGYRMFLFSVRQFYRNRKLGPSFALGVVEGMIKRSRWPRAEWWRKAACVWVRIFHRSTYKEALRNT